MFIRVDDPNHYPKARAATLHVKRLCKGAPWWHKFTRRELTPRKRAK